jgi:hypothetical protein
MCGDINREPRGAVPCHRSLVSVARRDCNLKGLGGHGIPLACCEIATFRFFNLLRSFFAPSPGTAAHRQRSLDGGTVPPDRRSCAAGRRVKRLSPRPFF